MIKQYVSLAWLLLPLFDPQRSPAYIFWCLLSATTSATIVLFAGVIEDLSISDDAYHGSKDGPGPTLIARPARCTEQDERLKDKSRQAPPFDLAVPGC